MCLNRLCRSANKHLQRQQLHCLPILCQMIRAPAPSLPPSWYFFIFLSLPPLTGVDVPLDLDILFWGGNFASYLTFSIFPRPSSRLNCRSMFCNYVIRLPLRFIVTFLHRSLVRKVINVSCLILPLWECWRFLRSFGTLTEFIIASVVLQIRHVDNWILYYVLSSTISTPTMIVMLSSFLSSSASLFPLLTSVAADSVCVCSLFFFFFFFK